MNEKKEQYEKSESKTRILIVDDHPVVRKGLIQLINHEPDLVVCAEAENVAQALEVLEIQIPLKADVNERAWLHVCDKCGYEWLSSRKQAFCPDCKEISISMVDERYAESCRLIAEHEELPETLREGIMDKGLVVNNK